MGKESGADGKVLNTGGNLSIVRGVALDGIISRSSYERIFAAKPIQRSSRRAAQTAQKMHLPLKRSVTLMRQTIHRPKDFPLVRADLKRSALVSKSPSAKKMKVAPIKSGRLARAKQVVLDTKVSRFGSSMAPLPKTITEPLKPAVSRISAKVAAVAQPSGPVFQAAHSSAITLVQPMPVLAPRRTVSGDRLEAMLDKALQQADSHHEILKTHRSRSILSRLGRRRISLMIISAVLVLGSGAVVAYYKVPSVAVRIAAFRAGVNAGSPSYVPPGFSLSQTEFKNGAITFKYAGVAGNLVVTEQKSGLTSQSLRDSVISSQNQVYQTTQYNGVTIYTYHPLKGAVAQSSASAVNDGVQSTVTNQANLSSDQIVKTLQSIYNH